MRSLPQRIIDYAESLPEATPLCPAGLLHLGKRAYGCCTGKASQKFQCVSARTGGGGGASRWCPNKRD